MMESARQELQGRREYMSNDEIKRLAGSIKCPMEQLLIRLIISWFHLTIFFYLGLDFSLGMEHRLRRGRATLCMGP